MRRRFAFGLLWAYKHSLGPVLYVCGARCRHSPSCSIYGAECVARHGVWAGGWMTLARLARCRPGGSHGHDPAPAERPRAPLYAPWRFGDWKGPPGD